MSTIPVWASGVFTVVLTFVIGQALLIYYGERFKNWSAQRSKEKMTKRIAEIKQDIEDARVASRTMTASLRSVYLLLYMLCLFLPTTILAILIALVTLMSQFLLNFYKSIESWVDTSAAISFTLLFVLLLFFLFVLWRVFQAKSYEAVIQHLKNVYDFEAYETKANQAIKHLEGRIERM